MITLRHHLLTLVAVFAALAVGIVLGAGVLSEPVRQTSGTQETTSDPAVEPGTTYPDEVAAALAPAVVAGRLTDRQVALVTLPGADETAVTALVDQVVAAGGAVAGRYDLTEAMVDPGQKSLVDTLGSQLMTQQPDGAVDTAAPDTALGGSGRAGAVITICTFATPGSRSIRARASASTGCIARAVAAFSTSMTNRTVSPSTTRARTKSVPPKVPPCGRAMSEIAVRIVSRVTGM